jgi:hypothetical protein
VVDFRQTKGVFFVDDCNCIGIGTLWHSSVPVYVCVCVCMCVCMCVCDLCFVMIIILHLF